MFKCSYFCADDVQLHVILTFKRCTWIYILYIPRNIWDTEYIRKPFDMMWYIHFFLCQITKTHLIFFFIIKNPFKSNKQPWNTTKKNSKDSNVSRLNSCRRIVYLYLSVSTGRQRPSCMSDAEIRQPRREPWRHCHGVPRTSGRGWKEAPLKSVRP